MYGSGNPSAPAVCSLPPQLHKPRQADCGACTSYAHMCRPTLEFVQSMTKLVKQESEKAKINVRGVRHKALEAVKKEHRQADERARASKEVSTGYHPCRFNKRVHIKIMVFVPISRPY